ncbi:MAG: ABC transporter ATP-binding protein [Gemmatimonadetes bacterium]|nr:ABC transporter ATP-binding protein [Gemmatimonadota bacterium]
MPSHPGRYDAGDVRRVHGLPGATHGSRAGAHGDLYEPRHRARLTGEGARPARHAPRRRGDHHAHPPRARSGPRRLRGGEHRVRKRGGRASRHRLRGSDGEVVAIVGASGSGKSTLADLLTRRLDPDAGRILLDGHDLRSLRLADLRESVALVEADPFLFHTTLHDNVRYARPEATDADVERALRAAGLGELVASMPARGATVVGERGKQLSTGERQRLALARAFLADPAVLILDEATGALDPATEAGVLDALEHLMTGRTTLLITHRLDLARRAGRVAVLEQGAIGEMGPPETLAREGSAFRSLFPEAGR